jgi:hypothetical protein
MILNHRVPANAGKFLRGFTISGSSKELSSVSMGAVRTFSRIHKKKTCFQGSRLLKRIQNRILIIFSFINTWYTSIFNFDLFFLNLG